MRRILIVVLIGAVVIVMLAAGALVVENPASVRGAERLDYGQSIQIDDFAFTALNSTSGANIAGVPPQGVFYVVAFQVTNHAKRVGFTFRPDTAILVDSAGGKHHVSEAARSAWFGANGKTDACARELGPGENCVTTLVFDVPADTQAPLLKISFAGGVFEIADALMYGNRVILLK